MGKVMSIKPPQCGDDRLSELPDELLCHILFFVGTEKSVQTSILSKRWLRVWTNVPSIDIDDSTLSLQEPFLVTDRSKHTSFIHFMNHIVPNLCNDVPIVKFTLKCSKFDLFHVNSWILSAVKCKVPELELDIRIKNQESFQINCNLFAYKELTSLKLGQRVVLRIPDDFSCQSLRKLWLDNVEFDDDSIRRFLSGCPVLEELHIVMCSRKHWDTLVVNAPSLRILIISTLCKRSKYSDTGSDDQYKLVLESPNLEVLYYSGCLPRKGFCLGNLDSLDKVCIDVGLECTRTRFGKSLIDDQYALEICRGISRAKRVILTDCTLELFSLMNVGDLPIFHGVTELRVGLSQYCSGRLFSQLLQNLPNLQHLVIDKILVLKGDAKYFNWERPDCVPECFTKHLEVVSICGFREETKSVFGKFIKYVVQNAKVLKECNASLNKLKAEEYIKIDKQLLKYL